ncbi:MAG: phosphoribosylamine--glycine ligase [Rhodospirillales bacterium]|nr:phosphoribosylamine--glycine ligase [Rhodospirillales bacterium]MYE18926.1 phosphoribosylamine--glycine ligase [Rhodospirillales bacterium]
MHILLIGSGGREHALAWALSASPLVDRLSCAPGNPGMLELGEAAACDPADPDSVVAFARETAVDLVVPGPEAPLVAGLVDRLEAAGIRAFGPTAAAARLEGSKSFTRLLCAEAGIPCAAGQSFDAVDAAVAYIRAQSAPPVIKADGLAAGKGVTVAATMEEAVDAARAAFGGRFGAAGRCVVVEERMEGTEASLFAIADGTNVRMLADAQDYKRIGDGDKGPNTGGMGAVSPAPAMTDTLRAEVMERIVQPAVATMARRGTPFRGILYAGLMLTGAGPKLVEFNVRFGDPECQALLVRLRSDLVPGLVAALEGELDNFDLRFRPDPAVCVVMAAPGYPEAPETGSEIRGLAAAEQSEPDVHVFQASTARRDDRLVAAGGRVLGVTATGTDVAAARRAAYAGVAAIDWPEAVWRRDIAATA